VEGGTLDPGSRGRGPWISRSLEQAHALLSQIPSVLPAMYARQAHRLRAALQAADVVELQPLGEGADRS